jgi:hypothetical protein
MSSRSKKVVPSLAVISNGEQNVTDLIRQVRFFFFRKAFINKSN